jgi:hypothetical protein
MVREFSADYENHDRTLTRYRIRLDDANHVEIWVEYTKPPLTPAGSGIWMGGKMIGRKGPLAYEIYKWAEGIIAWHLEEEERIKKGRKTT